MHITVFEFNPVQVNTYVLFDDHKNAVVIDCGAYSDKEKNALKKYIEEKGLSIKKILNTHLHFDHVLGNHFLYETYGIKPEYNQTEELMPGLREQATAFSLSRIPYEPVFAEHFIEDGDEIQVGDIHLKALLTPGHSPGSLSFYSEADHCVFTGDALFQQSIGRTDLWGGNHEELVAGIKAKLLSLPGDTVVYSGHGPSTTIQYEKTHNPYLT